MVLYLSSLTLVLHICGVQVQIVDMSIMATKYIKYRNFVYLVFYLATVIRFKGLCLCISPLQDNFNGFQLE